MIKTKDYKEFNLAIHRLSRKRRFPLRAMFELTYRCNFRCIHCYNTDEQKKARSQDELKTKEIWEILRQLKELGVFYLGLTGGEIFLRQDIFDILWFAKRLGFQLILLTNGYFIDEKIANELRRLAPNKVDITVHAMDKEIFDNITQVRSSAEKVFQAIDLLGKQNVTLGLKTCGMQENKGEIVKISQFSRSLNVIYRFSGDLSPKMDRSKTPLNHSISFKEAHASSKLCYPEAFTKHEAKGRLRKVAKIRRRNLNRIFNCGAGYTDLTISPYGELKLCLEIDYPKYKILEGSLVEGWQKIKDFVDGIKPPKDWQCRTCDLVKYCSWCPGKGYLEDGNFLTCSQSIREKAEFVKNIYESEN